MDYLKLLLFVGIIILAGCQEESTPEPEGLDPVEDLVGYLDPNQTVEGNILLYYQTGYLSDVIKMLEASPIAGDTFSMSAPTIDGNDVVDFHFIAAEVEHPFFFETKDDSADEIVAKHRIYKNARCKETVPPDDREDCTYIKEWGQYVNTEIFGWNQCKRGTEFCLELERAVGIRKIYEDTLCSILVRTEDIIQFSCDE